MLIELFVKAENCVAESCAKNIGGSWGIENIQYSELSMIERIGTVRTEWGIVEVYSLTDYSQNRVFRLTQLTIIQAGTQYAWTIHDFYSLRHLVTLAKRFSHQAFLQSIPQPEPQ